MIKPPPQIALGPPDDDDEYKATQFYLGAVWYSRRPVVDPLPVEEVIIYLDRDINNLPPGGLVWSMLLPLN